VSAEAFSIFNGFDGESEKYLEDTNEIYLGRID